MLRPSPTRSFKPGFILATALAFSLYTPMPYAQNGPSSSLPPTAPTQVATPTEVAPLTATSPQTNTPSRAHRAEVLYESGLISINAGNSSLNQILREIARLTGMKITGGVREERIFGQYGPATPDVILETLIDGNSTNLVLRHGSSNQPLELILTPRAGGASPPNPNAGGFDDSGDDEQARPLPQRQPQRLPQRMTGPGSPTGPPTGPPGQPQTQSGNPALTPNPGSVPPSIPPPANNVLGDPSNTSPTASTLPVTNSVPTDTVSTPSTTTQINQGIVDAPNPATDTTTPGTPSGAKTPQEIYEQLMKLRQQQQSTTPK